MGRIETCFENLRSKGEKGLITFITAGDPSIENTLDYMQSLVDGGADIIELGVPFSDPMADGPTIQRASERSLAAGTDLSSIKDMIINNSKYEAGDSPKLLNGYARFDEITLEFDQVLKPGQIMPGLLQVQSETGNYRVRKASVGRNSKEVIVDLKDDLPPLTFGLSLNYLDMRGDQKGGVIQSRSGQDVGTISAAEILNL